MVAMLAKNGDVLECTTFGRAQGDTLIDESPVVIEPEKPADTTF